MSIAAFLDATAAEMPRCDAERVGAERFGSPRLSAFELLGTNENTLSNVMAELFDPRGAHGQGLLFLNALLRNIGEPISHNRDSIKITREFATKHRRRIDILIETPSSLIGIENKPFAEQSENQLSDYQKDLEERAGIRKPRLLFISNSEPNTAKDFVTHLRFYNSEVGGQSLCDMLKSVRDKIRSQRAKGFVDDFAEWIERNLGGEQNMRDELEPYTDEVFTHFERAEQRKSIGAVLLAGDRIRREVINTIGSHVLSTLRNTYRDLEAENEDLFSSISQKHTAWKISRPTWPENCSLAIESERTDGGGIFYGVRALKPETPQALNSPGSVCLGRGALEAELQNIAGGSSSNWWPWYQRAPTSAWRLDFIARVLIETDGRIDTHGDIRKIADDLLRLANGIEEGLAPK